jgi:hypothetical protein
MRKCRDSPASVQQCHIALGGSKTREPPEKKANVDPYHFIFVAGLLMPTLGLRVSTMPSGVGCATLLFPGTFGEPATPLHRKKRAQSRTKAVASYGVSAR